MRRHLLTGLGAVVGTMLSAGLAVITNLVTGGTLAPWRSPGWLVFTALLVGILVLAAWRIPRPAIGEADNTRSRQTAEARQTGRDAYVAAGDLHVHVAPAGPQADLLVGLVRLPYPGLEAFTEEDADVFFGREQEIESLVQRLPPVASDRAHRFVAVVGPSGSGKSSLVQAGVVPRLARERTRWAVVPTFVPEDQPVRNLAHSVVSALGRGRVDRHAGQYRNHPARLVRHLEVLRCRHGGRGTRVLLVLDQAEELLTRTTTRERHEFLALLTEVLDTAPWLWVLATLRSDFFTEILQGEAAALLREVVPVGPLHRNALVEVIERPAAKVGARFDPPSLVPRIAEDTGGGDALPLLAYTLQRLWFASSGSGVLTSTAYERLGGVAGTLAGQADRIVSELRLMDPDAPVLPTLLKLVVLNDGTAARRRLRRARLNEVERQVVDAFVNARLLTSHSDGSDTIITAAHEALFRQWPPLRREIEARADALRHGARLEQWLEEWLQAGRDDAFLLTGARRRAACAWAGDNADLASQHPELDDYLTRSARHDDRAMENASAVLGDKALEVVQEQPELAMLVSLKAVQRYGATPQAMLALSTALTNVADDSAAVLTVTDEPASKVEPDALVVVTRRAGRDRVTDHGGPLRGGLSWSPDGTWLAIGGGVWDAGTGIRVSELQTNRSPACVAWSSEWSQIGAADMDDRIRVWHLRDWSTIAGRPISPADERCLRWPSIPGWHRRVNHLEWSPDDTRILAITRGILGPNGEGEPLELDSRLFVWSALTGELLLDEGQRAHPHLPALRRRMWSAAWSPDGTSVAVTWSPPTYVQVWDLATNNRVHDPLWREIGKERPSFIAWSPKGDRLLTVSSRTIRVRTYPEGREELAVHHGLRRAIGRAIAYDSRIIAAWSPDGSRIAAFGVGNGILEIWDASSGTCLMALCAHPASRWLDPLLAWSPDGLRIATSLWGDRCERVGSTRIWDVARSPELLVAKAREHVRRELTVAEQQRFKLDE